MLDNSYQIFQRVRYEETDIEVEDEVDILMSTDILAAQMSTKSINFVRAQSGWIFRADKTVKHLSLIAMNEINSRILR